MFFTRFQVTDERRIGNNRWRTDADFYLNYHVNLRDLDWGNVGARSGPVLIGGEGWTWRPFAGAAYSWFDYQSFYTEVTAGVTFDFADAGALKSILFRGAYQWVTQNFSDRDAYIIELIPRFVFPRLLMKKATAVFSPYYRYNGVVGEGLPGFGPTGELFPLRFHQIGARADYFILLHKDITLNFNFTVEYRHYVEDGPFGFVAGSRRDVYLFPGAQLVFSKFLTPKTNLILSYGFEHNASNQQIDTYSNHIVGLRLMWRIR